METTGIFFALLTTLSWSIGIFPFTEASRRFGTETLNNFRLLLATILIGVFCFFSGQHFQELFSEKYFQAWLWLGLSGIVGLTIGDGFGFVMYAILGARAGSALTTLAPCAAVLLGNVLLNEHVNAIGIVGMLITIFGVMYLSLGKTEQNQMPDHGHGSLLKGIIFGIIAALCQGAGLVLAKKGFLEQEVMHSPIAPFEATFVRMSIATLIMMLYTIIRGKIKSVFLPVIQNKNNGIPYSIAGTIFGPTLGVTLSLYTVTLIDVGVAQTIFSLVPVVVLLIAAIFFKENFSKRSFAGLLLAIAGVMILIWREKIHSMLFSIS